MRGNKIYWLTLLVLLALTLVGGVRLHDLAVQAGDRWPFANQANSLTREIAELSERNQNSVDDPALARELVPNITDTTAIADIRLMARLTGVEIDEIRTEKPLRGGGGAVRQDEFRLTLSGSYDQLALFFNKLEGFGQDAVKRLFVIDSLLLTADAGGRHDAEVAIMSFCYDGDAPRQMTNRNVTAMALKSLIASKKYVFEEGGLDPMVVPVFSSPVN